MTLPQPGEVWVLVETTGQAYVPLNKEKPYICLWISACQVGFVGAGYDTQPLTQEVEIRLFHPRYGDYRRIWPPEEPGPSQDPEEAT